MPAGICLFSSSLRYRTYVILPFPFGEILVSARAKSTVEPSCVTASKICETLCPSDALIRASAYSILSVIGVW